MLDKVGNWEVLLYRRFTGKITGKNILPVKLGKMQFFKISAKNGWKGCRAFIPVSGIRLHDQAQLI